MSNIIIVAVIVLEPKGLSIIYLFLLAKWERIKVTGVVN